MTLLCCCVVVCYCCACVVVDVVARCVVATVYFAYVSDCVLKLYDVNAHNHVVVQCDGD